MNLSRNDRRNALRRLNRRVKAALPLAGSDYSWREGDRPVGGAPAGPNVKYGNARNGLRVLVWEAQEGICAACGDAVDIREMDVAHIVGNGGAPGKNGGYIAGNIYGAHPTCNDDDAKRFGAVVPPASLVRPDLVPLHYWSRADMLGADQTYMARVSSSGASERERRLAKRLALLAEFGED